MVNGRKKEPVSLRTNAGSATVLRFTHPGQQTSAEEGGPRSAITRMDISVFTAFVFTTGSFTEGHVENRCPE